MLMKFMIFEIAMSTNGYSGSFGVIRSYEERKVHWHLSGFSTSKVYDRSELLKYEGDLRFLWIQVMKRLLDSNIATGILCEAGSLKVAYFG